MKHFYDHHNDDLRSKLNDHEFGKLPGAWDDMEKRLDQFSSHSGSASASWSAWFVIGAMMVATTVGIFFYQWQSPFGKTTNTSFADNHATDPMQTTFNLPIIKEPTIAKVETNETTVHSKAHQAAHNPQPQSPTLNDVHALKPAASNKNTAIVPAVATVLANNEENHQEVQTEEPGLAPNPDMDPDGQRPENNNNFPVYTRKTEVVHAFSESTLKWKNNKMPVISAQSVEQRRSSLIDTPLIVLQTPFDIPANNLTFAVNAGVSAQVYGSAGKFSLAPVVGVSVRKKIDENYALQGELHYKLVMPQSMDQPFQKQPTEMTMEVDVDPSAEVNYQTRNAQIYSVKSMHLFEMPVSFIYELHRRHAVSMGLKISYLQGVQTGSAVINNLTKEQLGFSSLDLGALAGYEFAINKHFALGVFYNVGFLNLAKRTKESAQMYNDQFSGSYMMDAAQQEEVLINDERMLPVQVDGNEQIFFQAPRSFYNSDLKILIRYIF